MARAVHTAIHAQLSTIGLRVQRIPRPPRGEARVIYAQRIARQRNARILYFLQGPTPRRATLEVINPWTGANVRRSLASAAPTVQAGAEAAAIIARQAALALPPPAPASPPVSPSSAATSTPVPTRPAPPQPPKRPALRQPPPKKPYSDRPRARPPRLGYLGLRAGALLDWSATHFKPTPGVILGLRYQAPKGLPLHITLEGAILRTLTLQEDQLAVEVARTPIALTVGASLPHGWLTLGLSAGVAMEFWCRKTVRNEQLLEAPPESIRQRYGGLARVNVGLPIGRWAGLFAHFDLLAYTKKINYLGEVDGERTLLLRTNTVSNRAAFGVFVRSP